MSALAAGTGMTTAGTVVVSVPAGGARDLGNNANKASARTDNTVTWQLDTTPPTCVVTEDFGGSLALVPAQQRVSVRDTGSGLRTITNIQAVNATVTKSPPLITVGTMYPVVSATRNDHTQEAHWYFDAVDVAGNVTRCGPLFMSTELDVIPQL